MAEEGEEEPLPKVDQVSVTLDAEERNVVSLYSDIQHLSQNKRLMGRDNIFTIRTRFMAEEERDAQSTRVWQERLTPYLHLT